MKLAFETMKYFSFVSLLTILSYFSMENSNIAVVLSSITALIFFSQISNYKKFRFLDILKTSVIIIPVIVLGFYHYLDDYISPNFFSVLLLINIAVIGYFVDIKHSKNNFSKINGILMIMIAFMVPKFEYSNGIVGPDDAIYYLITSSVIILYSYLFSEFYTLRVNLIVSLLIPLVYCLIKNDSVYWLYFRLYLLVWSILVYVFSYSSKISQSVNNKFDEIWKPYRTNDKIRTVGLIITIGSMVWFLNKNPDMLIK
jgi:hypothetical protein